jgi:glycosyltransferase involved in cell wall biosynthesis
LYEEGKVVVTQDRNMMDKSKMADKRGKEGPLVSIVTPSYNQGQFIEETTLSVKNQDYPNIEHIVVYGGSTDEILEILKRYEGTYNLRWISEPDEGHADAVNKGFAMAKGEIISWLNSDDVYFDKGTISSVMEAFQRHSEADIVYGNCVINL